MSNFYTDIADILASGEELSMASITIHKGSSPRSSGTRCAIRADGSIIGTIGGGLLEALTQQAGVQALSDGQLRYLELKLDNDELAASGMICGGFLEVMVVPWGAEEEPIARKLAEVSNGLTEGILFTRWDNGPARARVDFLDGKEEALLEGQFEELWKKTISTGKTTVLRDEGSGGALEPMKRERLPLIILGGGHVGKALADAASRAGFTVSVIDDREEFASREVHPEAHEVICAPFDSYLSSMQVDDQAFVVICTRGHQSDTTCALESLRSGAGYVGMIGSRRKRRMVIDHLKASGVTQERLQAFHTPTGLPIGAETPEEIAISILAEMIQLRRKK